ncbi:MAG: SusD family outer membrane lipoprotein NanU [Chitinophagaceae bacterium]|nr:MAG: SusD family outer membrane lipoprotein NanU [Chitinophagaceae bacterium]
MKKNIIYISIALGWMAAASSCQHELNLAPVSSISNGNYWKTPDQFDAFVSGIMSAFRSGTNNFELLGELRADVFGTDPGSNSAFTGEATQGIEHLWLNTLDGNNPGVSDFGGFYFNINQINLLISKLNSTNVVSQTNKNYYLGMAYGLRAFYYFQMLKSWGKCIIQTDPTTSFDLSKLAKPASGTDSVMALIKSDISLSEQSFGSDFSFRNQKSYWSLPATLMLKAHVYLWTAHRNGGTADAQTALSALNDIQQNVPPLQLLPDFASVFASNNKGNNEVIFAIHNQLNEGNGLPFAGTFEPQSNLIVNFYDSVDNRQFNVTQDNWGGLLRAPVMISTFRRFNNLDQRKWVSITAAYNLVGGQYQIAGCFASKYQGEQNAGSRVYTNDYPIYRYAGLLLLKAEAEVILGQSPANEINMVRQRAYGANYNPAVEGYPNQPIDKNPDPFEAILQERYFEFVFEGKRWYDLRRMGDKYVYEYTTVTPAESYMLLWPIDRNTLTNNPDLQQNPGYPLF